MLIPILYVLIIIIIIKISKLQFPNEYEFVLEVANAIVITDDTYNKVSMLTEDVSKPIRSIIDNTFQPKTRLIAMNMIVEGLYRNDEGKLLTRWYDVKVI